MWLISRVIGFILNNNYFSKSNLFLKKEWHLKWLNKIKGFFFLTIPLSFDLIINLIFSKESEEVRIDLTKYFTVTEHEIKIKVRLPFLLFYYLFSFLFLRNVRNFCKGLFSMIANLTFFFFFQTGRSKWRYWNYFPTTEKEKVKTRRKTFDCLCR